MKILWQLLHFKRAFYCFLGCVRCNGFETIKDTRVIIFNLAKPKPADASEFPPALENGSSVVLLPGMGCTVFCQKNDVKHEPIDNRLLVTVVEPPPTKAVDEKSKEAEILKGVVGGALQYITTTLEETKEELQAAEEEKRLAEEQNTLNTLNAVKEKLEEK